MPCYLPDVAYSSGFLPSFTFWIYQIPTNQIGVLLTLFFIWFITVAFWRNWIYSTFILVHQLFPVIYVGLIIHGMHQLFAYPVTWPFLLFPLSLFIFDKLWSFARVNSPLEVRSAQILPSKVVKLVIAKPDHLTYSSGQYIRLSSDFLGGHHAHPFSVTSAPNKDYISVHVRAVGPWTYSLYQLYHPMHLVRRPEPILLPADFASGSSSGQQALLPANNQTAPNPSMNGAVKKKSHQRGSSSSLASGSPAVAAWLLCTVNS